MPMQLAVQTHARSSKWNGLSESHLVKPSVIVIVAISVIIFFPHKRIGQIVMMENEEYSDTFICKLLLMSENAARKITGPYTSML